MGSRSGRANRSVSNSRILYASIFSAAVLLNPARLKMMESLRRMLDRPWFHPSLRRALPQRPRPSLRSQRPQRPLCHRRALRHNPRDQREE